MGKALAIERSNGHVATGIRDSLPEGNGALETLLCEFHWAALQVGAIASCTNASVALRRPWILRACDNLFPVQPACIEIILDSTSAIGLPNSLAAPIRHLYREIADAKKFTMPTVRSASSLLGPTISQAKLQQISAAWRRLAEDCEPLVQALEPEARWRLSGLYTGNALVLGRFLRQAVSGSFDCVNQIGEVSLPVLPQRRVVSRHRVVAPCLIRGKDQSAPALTRHLSIISAGVDCEASFTIKEPVRIEFVGGTKLQGRVAWINHAQIQVCFNDPLSPLDPLLTD
jgi:hypothetical protein